MSREQYNLRLPRDELDQWHTTARSLGLPTSRLVRASVQLSMRELLRDTTHPHRSRRSPQGHRHTDTA
jgi:hypothetical protein